jgi:hypothetical protein
MALKPRENHGRGVREMKRWLVVLVGVLAVLFVPASVAAADSAPRITAQPELGIVEEAGEVAQFSAHAEGTPAPTVRWQVAPDRNGPWSGVPGKVQPFVDTLAITASSENLGDAYRAVFTNSAGTAVSRPAKLVSRMDWMANLGSDIENVPLNELTIPGAHDMGTYGVESESAISLDGQASGFLCKSLDLQSACVSYARAQDPSKSAAEMLSDGIRYFDVRVCGSTGEPENTFRESWPTYTIHPVTCHGLDGASLEQILFDTRTFALAHPKEVVVLDVNHEFQVELYDLAEQIEKAFALEGGKSLMLPPQYCEGADNFDPGQCASQLTLAKVWHEHLGNVIVNLENDGAPGEEENGFHIQPAPNYSFYDSFPNLWGRLDEPPPHQERCTESSGTTSCFANSVFRDEANHWVRNTLETRETFSDTRHFFIQFLQTTPTPHFIKDESPGGSLLDMAVSSNEGTNPLVGPTLFECGKPESCFAERRPENMNILALNFYNRTGAQRDTPSEEPLAIDHFLDSQEEAACIHGNGVCDLTDAQSATLWCPGITPCYYSAPGSFDLIEEAVRFNEFARTPPVVDLSTSATPSANGWYNGATLGQNAPLPISVSAHDYRYPTGLTALSCLDGGSPVSLSDDVPTRGSSTAGIGSLSDGVHSIGCQATDGANQGFHHAGNAGAGPGSNPAAVFKVDTHAPTFTPRPTPLPNEAGWERTNVSVVWFWMDKGGSGIESGSCPGSTPSSGEGTITVSATCQDLAGNTATASRVVKVDTMAPTAAPTQVPAAGKTGWSGANVSVNWNWTDTGGSGIDPANCTTTSSPSGEGSVTLNATCQDIAGNTGTASYTVKVDKTTPAASPTQAPTANGAGWNRTNVVVNWNWTDKGSGVDPTHCTPSSASAGEGSIALSATCLDIAGNTGTASRTVKVDKIVPTVTYTGNAGTYSALATVAVTCTPADSVSGVASSTCASVSAPAWSLGGGPHTLAATATDVAGNVGSGSTVFTVVASPADLSTLTRQFVDGSAKYKAQATTTKAAIDVLVSVDCLPLALINSKLPANLKQPLIAAYKLLIQPLVAGGLLTSAQLTTLDGLAGAL